MVRVCTGHAFNLGRAACRGHPRNAAGKPRRISINRRMPFNGDYSTELVQQGSPKGRNPRQPLDAYGAKEGGSTMHLGEPVRTRAAGVHGRGRKPACQTPLNEREIGQPSSAV